MFSAGQQRLKGSATPDISHHIKRQEMLFEGVIVVLILGAASSVFMNYTPGSQERGWS